MTRTANPPAPPSPSRRGEKKTAVHAAPLRRALAPFVAAQWESLAFLLSLLGRDNPGDSFPFRYAGPRAELLQFLHAFILCGKIVPTAPHAHPNDCYRHLLALFHLPIPENLSDALAKALSRVNPARPIESLLAQYRRLRSGTLR